MRPHPPSCLRRHVSCVSGMFFPALLPCQLHIIVAVLGLVGQPDTLPLHWDGSLTEKESKKD